MKLQRPRLFKTKKELLVFVSILAFIFIYSLLIEYNNYKNLTLFDTAVLNAQVIKQYEKTKLTKSNKQKTYQVLKLKSDEGFSFYTTINKNFSDITGKNIELEIKTSNINFYEYLTSFYSYSKILHVDNAISLKEQINNEISALHVDEKVSSIYKALYTATPLNNELQKIFSNLGVSHLLAISGFHLGVLAAVLFLLFKTPYKYLQQRYFPYRSYKVDSFVFISILLLIYLIFLDTPPSLLRAYFMMIIGFVLYDRGYKIISMQTLLLTVLLLLSFSPRLFFSLGFWLSVSGVFYIFLFLIHFKTLSKTWQFVLVPFWVYLMMLPLSLAIFGNFSLYHPLSIIWTTLFTIFYPLSILLHVAEFADMFDTLLISFLNLSETNSYVELGYMYLGIHVALSLVSSFKKQILYFLLFESILIFSYAVYIVT